MEVFIMYNNSKKITNREAKNILNNKPVIWVDDSSINAYTNGTNFYNAGVYGWNYSIAYNGRLEKYVICGYRIPDSVLKSASEVIKMTQKEAFING